MLPKSTNHTHQHTHARTHRSENLTCRPHTLLLRVEGERRRAFGRVEQEDAGEAGFGGGKRVAVSSSTYSEWWLARSTAVSRSMRRRGGEMPSGTRYVAACTSISLAASIAASCWDWLAERQHQQLVEIGDEVDDAHGSRHEHDELLRVVVVIDHLEQRLHDAALVVRGQVVEEGEERRVELVRKGLLARLYQVIHTQSGQQAVIAGRLPLVSMISVSLLVFSK